MQIKANSRPVNEEPARLGVFSHIYSDFTPPFTACNCTLETNLFAQFSKSLETKKLLNFNVNPSLLKHSARFFRYIFLNEDAFATVSYNFNGLSILGSFIQVHLLNNRTVNWKIIIIYSILVTFQRCWKIILKAVNL